jgi:protein-tyrosine phosphatase
VPQLHCITEDIIDKLSGGHGVLVHCNHGFGRTGCLLTAVLLAARQQSDDIDGAVREVRECYNRYAVESEEQHRALSMFGKSLVLSDTSLDTSLGVMLDTAS